MARAPFQSLIIPFIIEDGDIKYAVFKRIDREISLLKYDSNKTM